MGRLGWSDSAIRRHDDARDREIAYRERRKREATRLAEIVKPGDHVTAKVLGTITSELGRAAAKAVDDASAPCLACGLNTYRAQVCNECLEEPYVDAARQDRDSAGYGYRAGGPDSGDRGAGYDDYGEVTVYLQEEL